MHSAKIILDSISPAGHRLTTMEIVFPRIVLAEKNTHRVISKNSASSRAIPVEKMLAMVIANPYIPTHWGKNQKGMQAEQEVSAGEAEEARAAWLQARDHAVAQATRLLNLGIHKQITNRLLEPFMWHTVIVTATEWDNFFHLRNNKDAHPDIRIVAALMQEQYESHSPRDIGEDGWHLPYIYEEDRNLLTAEFEIGTTHGFVEALRKISVARCARVSYLTHDGKRDLEADLRLYDRLLQSGHMSPLEHVARPMNEHERDVFYMPPIRWVPPQGEWKHGYWTRDDSRKPTYFLGNFNGWVQQRKLVPGEHDILGYRAREENAG